MLRLGNKLSAAAVVAAAEVKPNNV